MKYVVAGQNQTVLSPNMKIVSSEFIGNDYVKDQFRAKQPERIEISCNRTAAIELMQENC